MQSMTILISDSAARVLAIAAAAQERGHADWELASVAVEEAALEYAKGSGIRWDTEQGAV